MFGMSTSLVVVAAVDCTDHTLPKLTLGSPCNMVSLRISNLDAIAANLNFLRRLGERGECQLGTIVPVPLQPHLFMCTHS